MPFSSHRHLRIAMRAALTLLVAMSAACQPDDQAADDPVDGDVPDRATDADLPIDMTPIAPPAADDPPPIAPPAADDPPRFAFPIHPDDRRRIHPGLFFGVDHDSAEGTSTVCQGYDGRGFPFCYDGHRGSDFVLDGGFATMDDGSARVTAAAGGRVALVEDGHYDRCSGDLQDFEPDCGGREVISNKVTLEHPNGWRTRYLHLMRDSILVEEGEWVDCGAVLGLVGSSGRSFTPHLHFEVRDPTDASIDPFAGEVSGPRSLWAEQRADDGLPGPACDPQWGPARP